MKRWTHVLAASVAASALGLGGSAPAQENRTAPDPDKAQTAKATESGTKHSSSRQAGPTTQPAAFMLVIPVPSARVSTPAVVPVGGALAPDVEEIHDTLASATEAALTENGFNDFVERLVDADRNRIGKFDRGDNSGLDAAAAGVRSAWQSKFGSEFDIENETTLYAGFPVVQGVITQPLQPDTQLMPANTSGDYNLEPGREVAVVTLPGHDGLSDTTLVMIDEALGWKIDVPNTISGRELHGNLVKQLLTLSRNTDKWPASKAEAIRYITHHVMLAAVGKQGQTQAAQRN